MSVGKRSFIQQGEGTKSLWGYKLRAQEAVVVIRLDSFSRWEHTDWWSALNQESLCATKVLKWCSGGFSSHPFPLLTRPQKRDNLVVSVDTWKHRPLNFQRQFVSHFEKSRDCLSALAGVSVVRQRLFFFRQYIALTWLGFGSIHLEITFPFLGKIVLMEDGFHGAFRNACFTVNALFWVDVEHLIAFVEAFHGTYDHAIGVFTTWAGLSYDVSHESDLSKIFESGERTPAIDPTGGPR
jgi:hypothetical protein